MKRDSYLPTLSFIEEWDFFQRFILEVFEWMEKNSENEHLGNRERG